MQPLELALILVSASPSLFVTGFCAGWLLRGRRNRG